MAIEIGIIGPQDSMNLIFEVGEEFKEFHLNSFNYSEIREVVHIIEDHPEFKYWLFSGQSPYWFALNKGLIDDTHSSYIQLVGSGLIRTLLQAVYHNNFDLKRISFDTYLEHEIEEVFQELEVKLEYSKCFPYEGYMNEKKIVDFHLEQYREGKIDFAVTCIQSVYRELLVSDVPVVRVLATKNVIRQTYHFLKQKVETGQYLDSSIAIITLDLFRQNQKQDENYSYKFKKQLLNCEEQILSYAQIVNGSMVRMGDMFYFIFTTRGAIENANQSGHSLKNWLNDFSYLTMFKVWAGIGYGQNVFKAEKNGRLALQYARQQEKASLYLVSEEGNVEGPILDEDSIGYSPRSTVDHKLFEQLNISPMQWSRVKAYLKQHSKNEITANELSEWMHVTDRTARKILKELEQGGMAEIIGEEQPGPRGRPRKVYRIVSE